ncbi:hypothetical protein E2562_036933 [Oryza meyeriana var. granulata]|uniref:Uncharacterized protein n=1 Tax=Oryza meyeriana var. granulata TaxID=110450 RepID=A0A6G1FGM8_9ORYZ|nr:hypothetical protein E2562_036933 [Oryza meyeriana var. granulata]
MGEGQEEDKPDLNPADSQEDAEEYLAAAACLVGAEAALQATIGAARGQVDGRRPHGSYMPCSSIGWCR